MADKSISELVEATQIGGLDLFLLEQNSVAKKMLGQTLLNWLTAAADGHGGIQSIVKTGVSGLMDTYTITLADQTITTFTVTNARSITEITKVGSAGLQDAYQVKFNSGSPFTYYVTNGAKGDPGNNAYMHIKWASQKPSATAPSIGDIPDEWMGIYTGSNAAAPTAWDSYTWYNVKGGQGDPGPAASIQSQAIEYQVSGSGTVIPSGLWTQSIPAAQPGQFVWTRTTLTFNTGTPVVSYSVSQYGQTGPQGDRGETGKGFKVLDYYTTLSALQQAVTAPEAGDAYGVGTAAPYDIYIWSVTNGWVNNGKLQGAEGQPGQQGATGAPAQLTGQEVRYQVSSTGTTPPSGTWLSSVPAVSAGQYLWTRTTLTFNTGEPVVSYSVSLSGLNGQPGKDGEKGADGHTPVAGVDYFTVEEKNEFAQVIYGVVMQTLPQWNGGTY